MALRSLLEWSLAGATLLLSACASPGGGMGSDRSEAQMDASRMCAMYRQMTDGKSEDEQRAAVEAHIRSMHPTADPQTVAMHRQMMERSCASGDMGGGMPGSRMPRGGMGGGMPGGY